MERLLTKKRHGHHNYCISKKVEQKLNIPLQEEKSLGSFSIPRLSKTSLSIRPLQKVTSYLRFFFFCLHWSCTYIFLELSSEYIYLEVFSLDRSQLHCSRGRIQRLLYVLLFGSDAISFFFPNIII